MVIPATDLWWMQLGLVMSFSLVLGSFATALSYRLPRDLPMMGVKDRSRCVSCQHLLGIADLIPLLSWIFLKGRCRHCHASIGARYFLIETATLFLSLALFFVYGLSVDVIPLYFLAPLLVAMIAIDLEHKIIPDVLNAVFFLTGVLLWVLQGFDQDSLISALIGMLVYGGGAYGLRWVISAWKKREAMGLGDIKFLLGAGFWLGTGIDALTLYMVLAGGLGVVMALLARVWCGDEEIPFAPALIVAFVVTLFIHNSTLIS
jgi:leader peptidase (prepilin peptidase)/N-methyltransferase